ncbi:MAG: restriction endonuclease subunit S, partial [Bacteroidetes bacterium]|nr:restriction endonuclease subunit S [Bacteroidota bacterium]
MKYNNYYLSDICEVLIKTVNPKNTPENSFKVYSLPGYDNKRTPEFLKGNQISSNKIILSKKCILFNKLNLKFKRVWRYENVDDISISSTEFIPIVCKEEMVDFDYLYYYLINDSFYLELQGNASGTSNSHQRIHKEDLLKKQVQLPPLEVQKTISSFLRKIDDKIEYNDLIINNLKDIVGAYYEEMFIKNINKSNFSEISLATLMDYQGGSQPPASQFEYIKTDNNVRFVQ